MTVTAKERGTKSKKRRVPSVLEQLVAGCDAERVSVRFVDGRELEGALLFNPIKRSGKLINVEQEFSLDFDPLEVKEIRVLQFRSPSAVLERSDPRPERATAPSSELAADDDDD